MARRSALVLLVAMALVVLGAAAGGAATATTLPELPDGVNSIIGPNPSQVTSPQDPDDRGGANQLLLFGVIVVAVGGIGLLISRDVRRAKTRRAQT